MLHPRLVVNVKQNTDEKMKTECGRDMITQRNTALEGLGQSGGALPHRFHFLQPGDNLVPTQNALGRQKLPITYKESRCCQILPGSAEKHSVRCCQFRYLLLPTQHLLNRITRSLRTVLLFNFFSNLLCLFEVSRIIE